MCPRSCVNLVNFTTVPPSGRILYVNAAGLLFNTYLRCVCFSKAKCSPISYTYCVEPVSLRSTVYLHMTRAVGPMTSSS